jgi:hypothetical protein
MKYDLLGMILVTCGPLEGVLICLYRALQSEILFMEAQGCLDLNRGMKPIGWMMHPLSLDTWEDECCLWRHLDTMRCSLCGPLPLNVGLWRPKM